MLKKVDHIVAGNPMTISEHLAAARDLIKDPSGWTQGFFARDKSGNEVSVRDPSAVCFCASGAISRIPSSASRDRVFRCLEEQMNGYIPKFNDSHSHAEVLAAFDRAIAESEVEA